MEKRLWWISLAWALAFALVSSGIFVYAHEKFVLTAPEIASIENMKEHINVFTALQEPFQLFLLSLVAVFGIGIMIMGGILSKHSWAQKITSAFMQYELWGIRLLRVAFGFAMIIAGLYQTLFLPDLILSGTGAALFSYLEIIVGFFIVFNYATDLFAFVSVLFYIIGIYIFGTGIFDHVDVLGVAIYLRLTHHGQTKWLTSLVKKAAKKHEKKFLYLRNHAFDILRVLFGLSFVISGITKKFLMPEYFMTAIDTFTWSSTFNLEPVFFVMLFGVVEVGLGIILMLGIQTRLFTFIGIVLFTVMGFLMKEAVTGHLIIYAIFILILTTKEHKTSTWDLEKRWEKLFNI